MTRQEFSATLTARDQKTHKVHEVVLPHGAGELAVTLEFPRGAGYGNMLCLSLFDTNGFRGSGHRDGASHRVSLSATAATPGYIAGPVPAGVLRIVIHAHRIVAGETCPYRLAVAWDGLPPAETAPGSRRRAVRLSSSTAPGWRRGDLHAHTVHSDGDWDVPGFLSFAREAGVDFVALTDHNTTSQLAGIDDGEKPLVIPGMELTTFSGHAVSLGTREWIDWGVLRQDGMSEVALDVRRRGGLFVIAHPRADGDPACSGCDWHFPDLMPGPASAVEVWNGPWDCNSNNEKGLALWYEWLDAGHRIVATAGSDTHGPGESWERVGRNVVWSPDCTVEAILGAIAAGHLYVSAGPVLELSAAGGGRVAMMGETLAAEFAEIGARWEGCPSGSLLRLVGDGAVLDEVRAEGDGTRRWVGKRARWFTVEIRDRAGGLLAVTNPVRTEPVGAAS
jgi:hypothetical protein